MQRAALTGHPDVDVAFAGARFFGIEERDFEGPTSEGLLDPPAFFRDMYRADLVPAPTAVVAAPCGSAWAASARIWPRRTTSSGCGPCGRVRASTSTPEPSCDCANTEATSVLGAPDVGMNHRIHSEYAAHVADPRLARETLARDLRTIGRCRLGLGEAGEARRAYGASLRQGRARAAAWTALLSVPGVSRAVAFAAARRAGA